MVLLGRFGVLEPSLEVFKHYNHRYDAPLYTSVRCSLEKTLIALTIAFGKMDPMVRVQQPQT